MSDRDYVKDLATKMAACSTLLGRGLIAMPRRLSMSNGLEIPKAFLWGHLEENNSINAALKSTEIGNTVYIR